MLFVIQIIVNTEKMTEIVLKLSNIKSNFEITRSTLPARENWIRINENANTKFPCWL